MIVVSDLFLIERVTLRFQFGTQVEPNFKHHMYAAHVNRSKTIRFLIRSIFRKILFTRPMLNPDIKFLENCARHFFLNLLTDITNRQTKRAKTKTSLAEVKRNIKSKYLKS